MVWGMKQHVAIEQLNELSQEGKQRYREWWMKQIRFSVEKAEVEELEAGNPPRIKRWYEPLPPTIGQMIEFLDEYGGDFGLSYGSVWVTRGEPTIQYKIAGERTHRVVLLQEGDDLCEALWEAVKEVLEK